MAEAHSPTTNPTSTRPGKSAQKGLTREALNALLARLGCDRDEAARRYQRIHLKLVRLFAWRGCSEPEDLADETLDRVARKLEGGVTIPMDDPYRYISGVAYRLFLEKMRTSKRQQQLKREYQLHAERELAPLVEEVSSQRLTCLRRCLGTLEKEDRQLVLSYHEGERGERISRRKTMAHDLGMSANALQVRVCRLRQRLQGCTDRCLMAQ